jgi:hypothetical protein
VRIAQEVDRKGIDRRNRRFGGRPERLRTLRHGDVSSAIALAQAYAVESEAQLASARGFT